MESLSVTPDQLIRNFVSNTRSIIQCAECCELTHDAVRAGCEHVFCRVCLDLKFQNFDTEFTYCPICKVQLLKDCIKALTPKVAKLNVILKQCVEDFCEDAALNMGTYLGREVKKTPRTYANRRSQPSADATEATPKLGAKEKVEQWLMNTTNPSTTNEGQTLTPDAETASTETLRCSSSAQRSIISKESYDILPAPSPPPNDEPANQRRGRGRGRGRGQRRSALPISSGDRSDAKKRGRSAGSTPDSNKPVDQPLTGRLSASPAFESTHQMAATSTPLLRSTPLTAANRRGRLAKRPQSAFSERSRQSDSTADFPDETSVTIDVECCSEGHGEETKKRAEGKAKVHAEEEDQPEIMEVDLFDPSSPACQETRNEAAAEDDAAQEQTKPPPAGEKPDTLAVLIEQLLPDIQMGVDEDHFDGQEQTTETAGADQVNEDVLPTIPQPTSINQQGIPDEQVPSPFICITPSLPVDVDKSEQELNKENVNSLNAPKEPDHTKSQVLTTVASPRSTTSSKASSSNKLSKRNQLIPNIVITTEHDMDNTEMCHHGEFQKIVDYSSSSASPSVRKKTVLAVENPEPFERMKINFIHKSRLVPKQKVIVHERKVIPFVKKGKFDCKLNQQPIDLHQCPVIEKKTCLTKQTQTESFTVSHAIVQTDEPSCLTAGTQTESAISSDAVVQTEEPEPAPVIEKFEMEIQTDQELWNSFLKEVSGVFPMEATRDAGNGSQQRSRDASPDVFQNAEPFKRARALSESSNDENEPKRKRTSFDIGPPVQPEFQVPMPSATRAPSVDEGTGKTVIMESDQESDSVDVVAPTPPRRQPVSKLPPPPAKRVFTCSSLQRPQVKLVQEWAKKIGAEVVPTYTPAVTHVIVQVDADNYAQRTLKFLYGVAYGKWIVSVEWVLSSMRENCIVDEELFEALDMEGESGPSRSRMRSATSKLFQSFEFCCQEPFTDVTVDQLDELLRLCGAATSTSPAQIKKSRRHTLIVVQVDETNEAEVHRRAASWLDRYQVLTVSREWVLDCLASYKLLPIRPHLIGKHSDALLRILNFDEQLLR